MRRKLSSVVILAAWIITFSACTQPVRNTLPYPPLPLPERPKLPRIAQGDFTKVDDVYCTELSTVINIFQRDTMRRAYELRLENVIKSTHQESATHD